VNELLLKLDIQLNRLDHILNELNLRERLILLSLPLLLSIFLSYQYIWPMVEKGMKPINLKQRQAVENVATYKQLLSTQKGHGGDYLEQLAYSNQKLRRDIAKQNDINLYTEAKLLKFDFIRYEEEQWATFLDKIVTQAQNKKLRITDLHNHLIHNDSNRTFFPRFAIDMNVSGNFSNFFTYMTYLNSQEDFVDIYDLHIEGGSTINAQVKLFLWGTQ
jgi:type II secretory pathway component PulM